MDDKQQPKWNYDDEDEEESTGLGDYCECGRATAGDQCQQCGLPLCPMCSETGAGFCKDHPDEHYEDSQQGDVYENLRNATPEELLEAVSWFWRQSTSVSLAEAEEMIVLLRQGFRLAQPGGWTHVAPHWLRESQKLAALDG